MIYDNLMANFNAIKNMIYMSTTVLLLQVKHFVLKYVLKKIQMMISMATSFILGFYQKE